MGIVNFGISVKNCIRNSTSSRIGQHFNFYEMFDFRPYDRLWPRLALVKQPRSKIFFVRWITGVKVYTWETVLRICPKKNFCPKIFAKNLLINSVKSSVKTKTPEVLKILKSSLPTLLIISCERKNQLTHCEHAKNLDYDHRL